MTNMERDWLEDLYRKNFPMLMRTAGALVQSEEIAEELVQSTFAEAAAKISEVRAHVNPTGWLKVALKNKVRNYYRSRKRDIELILNLPENVIEQVPSHSEDICDLIDPCETRYLAPLKQLLPPDEYDLFYRIVFMKVSHKTMARELNISVSNCQQRLRRIRLKLRKTHPEYLRVMQEKKK